jgi:hypothetical protein
MSNSLKSSCSGFSHQNGVTKEPMFCFLPFKSTHRSQLLLGAHSTLLDASSGPRMY